MPSYFAHGSNMDEFQMRERCPSAKFRFVARVPNHELCFPRESTGRHGGVSSIEQFPRKVVWGVVYEVSEADLKNLNACEGYNPKRDPKENSYNRSEMQVERVNGALHRCYVYMANKKGSFLPSRECYLNYIIRGAEQHQRQGIPKNYMRKLRKIKTNDD